MFICWRKKVEQKDKYIKISDFYKALSDYSRLKIIISLLDNDGLCVSEIMEQVKMSQTAVSNQLKVLKITSIVKSERRGKNIIYSLNDEHVKDIINLTMVHMEENDDN